MAGDDPAGALSEADFLDDEHEESTSAADAAEKDSPPPPLPPPAPAPALESTAAGPMRPVDFPPTDRLPLRGVVADEPWPEAPIEDDMLPVEEGRMVVRPPPPPPLAFPDIDLNLTPGPHSRRDALPPAGDDTGNAQLQKALRRARVKSAKIAKAKARSEKASATEPAPLVVAASESERLDDPHDAPDWSGAVNASAFLQRRAVRLSLWGLAALGVLLLIAQVLRQERDLIAARQPALRPALEALCSLAGCQVSALRQIGDITIDGASFARERNGDAYRLSFTLRSAATVPLAMPAVELTLLDTQERAVVRRVLMPAEFGAPPVLSPRGERSASLPLGLTGPEVALVPPIAGYRVIAFYP